MSRSARRCVAATGLAAAGSGRFAGLSARRARLQAPRKPRR
ncbi:hypothetical protein [Lysobacter gummosus]